MNAWEKEEEYILETIKQECSLSYVQCSGVYNAYAKTLDKYSQEYTTRGITSYLKHYDKALDKMNSNAHLRPYIKSILNRNNYKLNGEQFNEFMSLEDIIGISYDLPKKFSNNIIPPHQINNNSNSNNKMTLASFIEDGKLQQHTSRDEYDVQVSNILIQYYIIKLLKLNVKNKSHIVLKKIN